MDEYSGPERRGDYIKLHDEIRNIDLMLQIMKNRYEVEFGSNNREGNIYRVIREVKETVKSQNGRIGKLENWRWFIVGGLAIIAFCISIAMPIGIKILDGINMHIKDASMSITKHVSHPEYHQNLSKELEYIEKKLDNK